MQTFENCVCIAQARVIAGFKRESHICTIAYQPEHDRFLRLCVPFVKNRSPLVKRWTVFDFDGSKDGLPNNDTREESWDVLDLRRKTGVKLTQKLKNELHCKILSMYKYQNELNDAKESIGVFIPIADTLRFQRDQLSPKIPAEKKALERNQHVLKTQGVWIPPFIVKVKGYYMKDGARTRFDKQLLAWDVYEALRGGDVDPFDVIYRYRHPYFIVGNTASHRSGWMVIGVLSAPEGAIERHAIHQQLQLV